MDLNYMFLEKRDTDSSKGKVSMKYDLDFGIVPTIEELIERVDNFIEDDVRDIELLVLPDEDLEKYPDPQVTSSDPYERKVARRLRIRNKVREKKRQEEVKAKEELGEEEEADDTYDPDNVVENQIETSTIRLLELVQDGRELISNVKVAAVSYEVKRRDKVRLERAQRRVKLEEAADEAKRRFMKISNQWAAVKNEKDPLDIHSATENQREKCMEVINKKDSIIEDLKKELEEADANFVKDLERQEEEINILVDRINQQINLMRSAANNELELLEAAIAVEREEMMKANETEWDELIEKKDFIASETNVIRNDIMVKHEKSLDALEREQREQLRLKRTEQTLIIHEMQLQLQELEALCLFNSEKLNHNYRVLKKRADENQIIKSQQKRTITKLQDIVSNLRKRIVKKELNLSNESKKMIHELTGLNRNIKDMERRADEFIVKNNTKFFSLWDFNQSQAEELIQKILEADKIMYEQFLDVPAPSMQLPILKKEDLPSYKDAKKISETGSEVEAESKSSEIDITTSIDERRILKKILQAVSKYASFLIEENVREVINDFSPVDQIIVRLDNILTTIGAKNDDEIKLLVKHFLPYLFCKTCLDRPSTASTEVEEEMVEEPQVQYEECKDEIIDEILARVRITRERELEVVDDRKKDIMEALSNSVKDRINVIDMVIGQEISGTNQLNESAAAIGDPTQMQLQRVERRRETIEIMPGDIQTYVQLIEVKEPMASSSLGLQMGGKLGRKHSLSLCLLEKHDISIDRLILVKVLGLYSKDLNHRAQLNENKSFTNFISDKWVSVSRGMSNADIQNFWSCYNVISQEKECLWDSFTEGLKEYHYELTERARLNEEVKRVKQSNNELMRLLQRYLSISVDDSSEMNFPRVKQYFPCPDDELDTVEMDNKKENYSSKV